MTPFVELEEKKVSFFAKHWSFPDRKDMGIWDMVQSDTLKRGMKEGSLLKSSDCSGRQILVMKVPRTCLSFSSEELKLRERFLG